MALVERRNLNWLAVVPMAATSRTNGHDSAADTPIGTIPAGSRVTVTKVIEFNYGFAMAPSNMHFTFGRLNDGPYIGKEVEVNHAGV